MTAICHIFLPDPPEFPLKSSGLQRQGRRHMLRGEDAAPTGRQSFAILWEPALTGAAAAWRSVPLKKAVAPRPFLFEETFLLSILYT